MAYTGTYEQELRKNPTDFKLRAMGKKKYELKRSKDGKVTVSTKGEPKNLKDFRSKKNSIEAERKSRTRRKNIFDAIKQVKEKQKSKDKESSQKESSQREVKTTKDDVSKTDNEDKRTRKIELQNNKKRDVSIPSQALENIMTGTAVASLGLGTYALKKVKDKRKADKMRMASDKLKNMKPEQQKKVVKDTIKKTMDKMKNAKPSVKRRLKSYIERLRKKLSSGFQRSGGGSGVPYRGSGASGSQAPIKGQTKKTDIRI